MKWRQLSPLPEIAALLSPERWYPSLLSQCKYINSHALCWKRQRFRVLVCVGHCLISALKKTRAILVAHWVHIQTYKNIRRIYTMNILSQFLHQSWHPLSFQLTVNLHPSSRETHLFCRQRECSKGILWDPNFFVSSSTSLSLNWAVSCASSTWRMGHLAATLNRYSRTYA